MPEITITKAEYDSLVKEAHEAKILKSFLLEKSRKWAGIENADLKILAEVFKGEEV